jgi:hypothetical protein
LGTFLAFSDFLTKRKNEERPHYPHQSAPYPGLNHFPSLVVIKALFPAILVHQPEGFPIRVTTVMILPASVVAVPGIAALIHDYDLL